MLEIMLNECANNIFFDEGSAIKQYKSTPCHIISSYTINGDLWGFEGKKIHEILHEGCDMGVHWHTLVLLPSDADGTSICQTTFFI